MPPMGNPPYGSPQGPPPFRSLTRTPFLPYAGTNNIIFEITHSFYLYMTVILFSLLLRIRSRLYLAQKEKMIAELNSLKNQINPHFLFNTLNSIYALAVRKDEQTADSIINLAGMMRYMIKDATGEKIALQKELDFLSHYIELQKNRLRSTAQVDFSISGNPTGLDIAPLILITFIENAFKYGVNPDMDSPVSIRISIEKEALNLAVSNYKVLVSHPEHSTRIGLANTRKRLDLLYQRKHLLNINEDKEKYAVNLSIQLI
jgi:LytS/YehU family sensor histidine kinase